jgi:hypothetical protein
MTLPPTPEIKKRLQGSWQLPLHSSCSVTMFLQKTGEFRYIINATTSGERIRQLLAGHEILGTWSVHDKPLAKGFLDSSARGSLGSSFRMVTYTFAPPTQRAEPQKYDQDEKGPFLCLNFTDLAKSVANINIVGIRVEVANWINKLREVIAPDVFKILDLTPEQLQLEGRKGIELWRKGD